MICPYCGADLMLELEVWDHEWWPAFCCEQLTLEWQEHFERYGADEDVYALFLQLSGGALGPTRGLAAGLIDFKLVGEILTGPEGWRVAKDVIARYHRHHPPPVGWKFGAAVWNGPTLVGVATVGRPVSAAYDQRGYVEVNRACTRDLSGLERHAASKLYALCAQEAQRRKASKIITYTYVDESGVSLKAAGWTLEARIRGRSWSCPSRPRQDKSAIKDKNRWGRSFRRMP